MIGRSVATARVYLEMIKISHTIFALPFAIGATFLAARGIPDAAVIAKVILAVFFARTAALSFNRIADRRFDADNPRTASRALPAGTLSVPFVAVTTAAALAGFFAVAWWINPLAFALSPIAVMVIIGYSFTKRFTALCHLFLGAALALAPMGAWVAVRGSLGWEPWLIGIAVLLWTAGFDVIYACMDADFDRRTGLRSIPARFGIPAALRISTALHVAMLAVLGLLWWSSPLLGAVFLAAVAFIVLAIGYEHSLVRPHDLSRVNHAFFTMNGIVSFALMGAMILEATLP